MDEVTWTTPALRHLRQACVYLEEQASEEAAEAFQQRVFDAVGLLNRNPRMGRRVPNNLWDEMREIYVRPFRLFYVIEDERCYVVAMVHERRDLSRYRFPRRLD
jgi:plasmid stabilization system protein ParE